MVSRISSERKVTNNAATCEFEYSENPLRDVLRASWGRPESTSRGRAWNVRLGRPLDIISGRPQDVRLGRSRDVRSGGPRDGQIGSLGAGDVGEGRPRDVLGTNISRLGLSYIQAYSEPCATLAYTET